MNTKVKRCIPEATGMPATATTAVRIALTTRSRRTAERVAFDSVRCRFGLTGTYRVDPSIGADLTPLALGVPTPRAPPCELGARRTLARRRVRMEGLEP